MPRHSRKLRHHRPLLTWIPYPSEDTIVDNIISEQQLKEIFTVEYRKTLIGLMEKQNVRYLCTREGAPFTTLAAINDVLIGQGNDRQEQAATFGG